MFEKVKIRHTGAGVGEDNISEDCTKFYLLLKKRLESEEPVELDHDSVLAVRAFIHFDAYVRFWKHIDVGEKIAKMTFYNTFRKFLQRIYDHIGSHPNPFAYTTSRAVHLRGVVEPFIPWFQTLGFPVMKEAESIYKGYYEKTTQAADRLKKILKAYRDRKALKQDRQKTEEWFVNEFMKDIRLRVLPKGMRLFRGTVDKQDPIMKKGFIYMSDNPFAYIWLNGVDVKYLHEYRLTRDVYIMDYVSHPDICRPKLRKLLLYHDKMKKRDKDPNQFYSDPQPSKYLQLRMYQRKKILGHMAIAHLDCPDKGTTKVPALDERLKTNGRPNVKGFPEYVFYNQLSFLSHLNAIEHVGTYPVAIPKYKKGQGRIHRKKLEAFYKDYQSPKPIQPALVSPSKKKKTTRVKNKNGNGRNTTIPVSEQAEQRKQPSPKQSSPAMTIAQKRAYYTKIRAKVKKTMSTTLTPEQFKATIGKYAAYWPDEGCLLTNGHYVGYGPDDFPRCFKVRKGAAGMKAMREVYERSKTKSFFGYQTQKLAEMETLLK